jgi:hypothetical protein
MSHVLLPLIVFFLSTAILALLGFGMAVHGSKRAVIGAIVWMGVQSAIALTGFYFVTDTLPPRFALVILPPVVVIAGLFATAGGRRYLDAMDLRWCVLLHTVRVPVEITLYWLFLEKQMPRLMTFEGGNLDILIGVTAPVVWWSFTRKRIGRTSLLVWNGIALVSVLNALVRAMLSAPFRFQRFAFDQPSVAILSFPFVLLPAFIVPAVLLCHLVVFRKLSHEGEV